MFGERLKLARNRKGLSLRALAVAIGHAVTAQAIGCYERGEMQPGSEVALKLAKALDVHLGYLFSPYEIRLEGVEFRKKAATKAQERAMVEATVLDHVDRYLTVEEALGIASHDWQKPQGAPYSIRKLEDAEAAAEEVRRAWNLGGDPISNVTELFEEHGMKVLCLDFPLSVDGLSCQVTRPGKEKVPVIVCSQAKSVERRRFTVPHEGAHLVLDIRSTGLNEETACHRFASAFLIPRELLLAEIGRRRRAFGYTEIVEIKRLFGVSAAALVVRLRDLGVISDARYQSIFLGMGKTWRQREPAPLSDDEEPRRFQRLVLRALAEKFISLPKAAELLRKSTREVERSMAGPRG